MPKTKRGFVLDDREMPTKPTHKEWSDYVKIHNQMIQSALDEAEKYDNQTNSKSATIPERSNKNG